MTEPRVRLYGYAHGEGSFTQVTRGIRRALESMNELAGFWPVDSEDREAEGGGMTAPVALNCGNPRAMLQAHRSGSHLKHWLLLAPNSEGLPAGFAASLMAPSDVLPHGMLTGGLLAPSKWAARVLREAFPGEVPVLVAPHGVMPEVHKVEPTARASARKRYQDGDFKVLHMSSTEADRKGTKPLLQAWAMLKRRKRIPPEAVLYVVMNPTQVSRARWWCRENELTEGDAVVCAGLTSQQSGVAELYSAMHMVCQPSRAEGFGLVPLEALSCGVPVVVTNCTGHKEYLDVGLPGVMIVEHDSYLTPSDDFRGARSPTIHSSAIEEALAAAFNTWSELAALAEANAPALATEWAWEKVSAPALREMVKEH